MKNLYVGSFNYFSYTIQKGTWIQVCVTKEVAFSKANST